MSSKTHASPCACPRVSALQPQLRPTSGPRTPACVRYVCVQAVPRDDAPHWLRCSFPSPPR
eukprot:8526062-Alexandrium_andersonii.AAC.1